MCFKISFPHNFKNVLLLRLRLQHQFILEASISKVFVLGFGGDRRKELQLFQLNKPLFLFISDCIMEHV